MDIPRASLFFDDTPFQGEDAWYAVLCCVAAVNVLWLLLTLCVPDNHMSRERRMRRRLQILVAAPHVLGFACLTFLPTQPLKRIVLRDEKYFNVFYLRVVLAVGEIFWMGQLGMAMYQYEAQWADQYDHRPLRRNARGGWSLVVLISFAELLRVLAEMLRDGGVLICGEIIRVCAFFLLVPFGFKNAFLEPQKAVQGCCAVRVFALGLFVYGLSYAVYALLFCNDIIRWHYYDIWYANEPNRTIKSGFKKMLNERNESMLWDDWHGFVWYTAVYFNLTSWVSLALLWPTVPSKRASPPREIGQEIGKSALRAPDRDPEGGSGGPEPDERQQLLPQQQAPREGPITAKEPLLDKSGEEPPPKDAPPAEQEDSPSGSEPPPESRPSTDSEPPPKDMPPVAQEEATNQGPPAESLPEGWAAAEAAQQEAAAPQEPEASATEALLQDPPTEEAPKQGSLHEPAAEEALPSTPLLAQQPVS